MAMIAQTDAGMAACRSGDERGGLKRLSEAASYGRTGFGPASPFAQYVTVQIGLCVALTGRLDDAASMLASVDPAVADRANDHADSEATIELVHAAQALAQGDAAAAQRLIGKPTQVFSKPGADPFLQSWTAQLQRKIAASLGAPSADTGKKRT